MLVLVATVVATRLFVLVFALTSATIALLPLGAVVIAATTVIFIVFAVNPALIADLPVPRRVSGQHLSNYEYHNGVN